MAKADPTLLQSLLERLLAEQAALDERLERVEHTLLHLSNQMDLISDRLQFQIPLLSEDQAAEVRRRLAGPRPTIRMEEVFSRFPDPTA
jgi:hypothetical protein